MEVRVLRQWISNDLSQMSFLGGGETYVPYHSYTLYIDHDVLINLCDILATCMYVCTCTYTVCQAVLITPIHTDFTVIATQFLLIFRAQQQSRKLHVS